MPVVLVPSLMRDLTGGRATVAVAGTTVEQVVANLEALYPGVRGRLCRGGDLNAHVNVIVDGCVAARRMLEAVQEESEIQFLAAMQGGSVPTSGVCDVLTA